MHWLLGGQQRIQEEPAVLAARTRGHRHGRRRRRGRHRRRRSCGGTRRRRGRGGRQTGGAPTASGPGRRWSGGPVRKLARVDGPAAGRPQGADLRQRQLDPLGEGASPRPSARHRQLWLRRRRAGWPWATTSSSRWASSAVGQASLGVVAVSRAAASARAAAQASIGWRAVSRSRAVVRRSRSSVQPAREIDAAAARRRRGQHAADGPLRRPPPWPCRAAAGRGWPATCRPRGRRACSRSGGRRRAPSGHGRRRPISARARSSSSKRKRRRIGSRPARSSTWPVVTRADARSSSSATTPSTGLVWRRDRSARRTRRSTLVGPVATAPWLAGSAEPSGSAPAEPLNPLAAPRWRG